MGMILKIFIRSIIALVIILVITSIFDNENERCKRNVIGSKKYRDTINKITDIMETVCIIAVIIFTICNIALIICGIINKDVPIMILGILFIITMIFLALAISTEKFRKFNVVMASIGMLLYMLYMLCFFLFQINASEYNGTYTRKVNTISIVEMKEVPYTNISGGRYYICSEPSLAYYYDIVTDTGGTTTKVIDGHNNYVEKFEDDIYEENPHIDVFEVVQKLKKVYFKTESEFVKGYKYYIYIPKDGIYYNDKE